MPTFQPMKAYSKTPNLEELNYPLYASPKLDGIRCILKDGVAYSRSMKPIPNKFVQEELGLIDTHGLILDGELMVNGDFNDVQSGIMSQSGKPDFYFNVFDIVDETLTFEKRLVKLNSYYSNYLLGFRIRLLNQVVVENENQLQTFWNYCISEKYEGVITRAPEGKYKFGRSTLNQQWMIKLKKWHDAEATVVGFKELEHNENAPTNDAFGYQVRSSEKAGMVGSDMLGALEVTWEHGTFYIGSGFDEQQRIDIWANYNAYIGKTITFKYQELTKYNEPRFPVFKGFRND